jgi:ribonuclease BN (tRNA processing enzyme)
MIEGKGEVRLKVLGTGTCIPSLTRGSAAYLVFSGGRTILIDAGPATVRRLLEFGYTVDDIDIIVVTHFHVDHTADLATFLFACNYGAVMRKKSLLIIGGQGIHKFYRGLLAVYPWVSPKGYSLTLKSMPAGILEEENFRIETRRMKHNRESIGVRIGVKESITFTGDTDYSRNLIDLARHTDVLVAECAFPEKKVKGHMNLAVLNKVVHEAQPGKVLLTHLYPEWDNFREVLYAPYLMAEDGLELKV